MAKKKTETQSEDTKEFRVAQIDRNENESGETPVEDVVLAERRYEQVDQREDPTVGLKAPDITADDVRGLLDLQALEGADLHAIERQAALTASQAAGESTDDLD